jgi:hypothetical protein
MGFKGEEVTNGVRIAGIFAPHNITPVDLLHRFWHT